MAFVDLKERHSMSIGTGQFRVRPCSTNADDLSALDRLTNSVFFDIGISNWKIYLETSPSTIFLIEEQNTATPVGLVSYNMVNEELQWQHLGIVLPRFRQNKLFGRVLNLLPSSKSCSGNRNQIMLNYYNTRRVYFSHKQLGFYGNICAHSCMTQAPRGILIRTFTRCNPMDSVMLSKVLAYDDKVYEFFKAPRRSLFTKAWLEGNGFISAAVAIGENEPQQVHGYGVVRMCVEGASCRFTPVYADTSSIAGSLLSALASVTPTSLKVYVEFPAHCRPTLGFCSAAGLKLCYCNVRVYENFQNSFPLKKLFADNDFWPM